MILISIDNDLGVTTPVASAAPSSMTAGAPAGTAGSMESATEVLAARLAAKGGSDEDWNLLAQSYDFLGRADEAKLAREHKVSPQRSLQDSMAATAPVRPTAGAPGLMPQAAATDSKFAALFAQAEQHRRKREFKQACDVYRKVIAAGGMTADAWADYADALASSTPNGSLSGEPAKAIEQALAHGSEAHQGLVAQGEPRARGASLPGRARDLAQVARADAAGLVRRTHHRSKPRRVRAPRRKEGLRHP